MPKPVLIVCSLFFLFSFCNQPERQEANGEGTFQAAEPAYEKMSENFNSSNFQELPQTGQASYYAGQFHGRITASGEVYDSARYTAAHRTLPFGTKVKVTNLKNDKKIVVTINDRGPHHKNRIIDLSEAAARRLNFLERGTTKVRLEEAE